MTWRGGRYLAGPTMGAAGGGIHTLGSSKPTDSAGMGIVRIASASESPA